MRCSEGVASVFSHTDSLRMMDSQRLAMTAAIPSYYCGGTLKEEWEYE